MGKAVLEAAPGSAFPEGALGALVAALCATSFPFDLLEISWETVCLPYVWRTFFDLDGSYPCGFCYGGGFFSSSMTWIFGGVGFH